MKEEFKNTDKLYHFTKFDTAIKILESHRLRFGRLHNMNDIHENDKMSYQDLDETKIDNFSLDVLDAIDNEMLKYRQISFTIDDDKTQKLGFDLHQMWGLYADKGQGVCLVFDKNVLCNKLDSTILCESVSYNTTVESFFISSSKKPEGIKEEIHKNAKKLFFHKRKEWEHEQEYRLLKYCPNIQKEEYLNYREALKYIILNSALEDVDRIQFIEIVKTLNKYTNNIPILVYGNGLLEYSLINIDHSETIWNSHEGYEILIPGKNCEIDVNLQ